MKQFAHVLISLFFVAALAACGGEDSTTDSMNQSQTCKSDHECVNGVCECTTDGKSGQSCNEDDCEDDCEVCSSS